MNWTFWWPNRGRHPHKAALFLTWPAGNDPDQPLPISEIKQHRVKPPPLPPTQLAVDEVTTARLAGPPQQAGLVLEVDTLFSTTAIEDG